MFSPLGNHQYRIEAPLALEFKEGTYLFIPRGWITDLASFPKALRGWLFPADGPWLRAAVVHDYLYMANQEELEAYPWTRKEADMLFHNIMAMDGVGAFTRYMMYLAVRMYGRKHWEGPARLNLDTLTSLEPPDMIEV